MPHSVKASGASDGVTPAVALAFAAGEDVADADGLA